jgi:hypothetical protein
MSGIFPRKFLRGMTAGEDFFTQTGGIEWWHIAIICGFAP